MDVNLEITNATKLRVLVKAARASGLFTRKFFDAYEDSTNLKTWTVQLPLFIAEYANIMRAAGRADAETEYESAAALREERRHTNGRRPASQGTSAAVVDNAGNRYKAAMEYAAALEEHIAKLTEGGAPVPSALPIADRRQHQRGGQRPHHRHRRNRRHRGPARRRAPPRNARADHRLRSAAGKAHCGDRSDGRSRQ